MDEKAMIEEIKGNTIPQYFYEYEQGGKTIIGISFAGVKYIASRMRDEKHPISAEHTEYTETDDVFRAICYAKDLSTGEKRIGAAEQPKRYANGKDIAFAFTLAISKAERNAIRHFIDEKYIQEGYRAWKAERGGAPSAPRKEQQVSKVTKEELEYELKEFNGLVVMQAEHELQVVVPAKALLDQDYIEKLKTALDSYGAFWVPKTKDHGPYYSVKTE